MRKFILAVALLFASFSLLAQNQYMFEQCLEYNYTEMDYDVDFQTLRGIDNELGADRYTYYELSKCDFVPKREMFYVEHQDIFVDGNYAYLTRNDGDTIYRTKYEQNRSWDTLWVHKYVFDNYMRPLYLEDGVNTTTFTYDEDDVFIGIESEDYSITYVYDNLGNLDHKTIIDDCDTSVFDYTFVDTTTFITGDESKWELTWLIDWMPTIYDELIGDVWVPICATTYPKCWITGEEEVQLPGRVINNKYYDLLGRELQTEPQHGFFIHNGRKYYKR